MVTVMYLCWGDILTERGSHPLTCQKPVFSGIFLVSSLVSVITVGNLGFDHSIVFFSSNRFLEFSVVES
jgi:hypothetical protein